MLFEKYIWNKTTQEWVIVTFDASAISAGTFNVNRIPALAPNKLSAGTNGQILKTVSGVATWSDPGAEANNYLTGVSGSGNGTVTFTREGLSNLTWNATHAHAAGDITSGTFNTDRIPLLDAAKISTGVLSVERIPNMDASKITTGAFLDARIPNLAASKITSGTFDDARIPNLNASKTTAGTFHVDRIPVLPYAKTDFANQNLNTNNSVVFNGVSLDMEGLLHTGSLVNRRIVGGNVNQIIQTPIGSSMWHDVLAFGRQGSPTYETFDGNTWTSKMFPTVLLAHKEAQNITVINHGAGERAARFEWDSVGFHASLIQWFVFGFGWTNGDFSRSIHIELKTATGEWVTAHQTTSFTGTNPVWLYNSASTSNMRHLRITITAEGDADVRISTIRALSSRWGDQGQGKEWESPWDWDGDRNLSTPGTISSSGQLVVLNNDSRLSDSRTASDVYAWAKAATKPSYNASEIGGLGASYRWLTDAYITTWNNKENAITKGTTAQYFRGDMSLATFPTTMTPSAHDQAYTTINNFPTGNVAGRNTAGTGALEAITYANLKTYLNLNNVENKSSTTIRGEITSGNVTGALGFTPYNATNPNNYISEVAAGHVTNTRLANMATATIKGRVTAGTGSPEDLNQTQVRTFLGLGTAAYENTSAFRLSNWAPSWTEVTSKPSEFNPTAHPHGNITNTGAIGTTANLVIVTGASGVLTAKTAGTTAQYLRGDGAWVIPPNDNTTYSLMTSSVLGLGKLFNDTIQSVAANSVSATASRTYGIQTNSDGQSVVNVPWTDTTYSLISTAEIDNTGSATARLISGNRLAHAMRNIVTTSTTLDLGAGATSSGNTKTINIGTGGLAGSNTLINLGNENSTVTIAGTLLFTGEAFSIETTSLKVSDYIIEIAKDNTVALTNYAGFVIPKYDGTNAGGMIIDSDGEFRVGDVSYSGNIITDIGSAPLLARAERNQLTNNDIFIWNSSSWKAEGRNIVGSGATSVSISGSTITISSTDNNTTYSAGTGLSLSGTTFNHSNSITAGNFGDTGATRTLVFGGTFIVPYVTYDAQGHITGRSNLTLTMPANPNTDTWRTVQLNDTSIGTNTLNIKSGTNVTVTASGGTATLSSPSLSYSTSGIGTFISSISVSGHAITATLGTPPDNDTITRLRGTTGGTYVTGDITLAASGATSISQSGNTITISSVDTNTTYSAGTGLSLSGTTFNHSNSITAGNFGDTGATRTLTFAGAFVIPYVTYDAQGHITGITNKTMTLPANPNTDTVTRLRGTTGGTFVSGDITLAASGATSISQSGNTITISSVDTNTTYSAGTGLSLSGTTFNHSNSITASNTGPTSNSSPGFGTAFTVPYVTYDAQGHITSTVNRTVTLPANPNTDTNWYPTTFTWTAGTTAGPTGSLTLIGTSAVAYAAIPAAASNASGIVTTGTQVFGGAKSISLNMINGSTAAFTNPHLALAAGNTIDNTGFVGMTFATSSTANYGYSYGALRSTNGLGDLVTRFHNNSAQGSEVMRLTHNGNLQTAGSISATGTVSATNDVQIASKYKIEYNSTEDSLDFIYM